MEFDVQVRNSQIFEKSLLNKIARVATSLEREVETELKVSFALTFSQFRVLNGLLAIGEASQRQLAAVLGVTPAVVTRQAEALSARGLVIQRSNPRSKRENLVVLTPKGEQAALDAGQMIQTRELSWRGHMKVQDEVAFERVLTELAKSSN